MEGRVDNGTSGSRPYINTSRSFNKFLARSCRVGIGSEHVGRLNKQHGRLFNTCQSRRHVLLQDGIFAVVDRLIANLHTSQVLKWRNVQAETLSHQCMQQMNEQTRLQHSNFCKRRKLSAKLCLQARPFIDT